MTAIAQPQPQQPLVRARGLTRRYPAPRNQAFERRSFTTALQDADIDIQEGSSVGIIGESGSGKSTLVRLLLALDEPTAGTVEFDGRLVDASAGARSSRARTSRPSRRRASTSSSSSIPSTSGSCKR